MAIRFDKFVPGLALLLVLTGSAYPEKVRAAEKVLSDTVQEAVTAGIPPVALNRLLAYGFEQKSDPADLERIMHVLMAVQKDGLPLRPFVNKMEEGIAKRIVPPRIAQVLEKKEDDYRFARALMADHSKGQVQQQVRAEAGYHIRLAELFGAGLFKEDLKQLFDDGASAPLPVVIRGAELLASLRQFRFDSRLAGQIVSSGLKYGYFTADQADLARIISAAKNKGLSDEEIATAAIAVIRNNSPTNRLSSLLGVSASDLGAGGPQGASGPSGTGTSGMGAGDAKGDSAGGHGGDGGGGSSGSGGGSGGGGR